MLLLFRFEDYLRLTIFEPNYEESGIAYVSDVQSVFVKNANHSGCRANGAYLIVCFLDYFLWIEKWNVLNNFWFLFFYRIQLKLIQNIEFINVILINHLLTQLLLDWIFWPYKGLHYLFLINFLITNFLNGICLWGLCSISFTSFFYD